MSSNAYDEAKEKIALLGREADEHWNQLVGKFLGLYLGEVAPLMIALQRDIAALRLELSTAVALMNSDPEETLTGDEAARYLKVNRRTIANLARRGEIGCVKVGKMRRFYKKDLTRRREESCQL